MLGIMSVQLEAVRFSAASVLVKLPWRLHYGLTTTRNVLSFQSLRANELGACSMQLMQLATHIRMHLHLNVSLACVFA